MTSPRLPSFNPRLVPVTRVDSHMAPVMPAALTPQALRRRFELPPVWLPEIRAEPSFLDRPPQQAAVLIPIVLRDTPMVLLTQRTEHLSTHSGQIAFPGGKCDASDADATAAALRETFEEVGLEPCFVDVLGQLPTYITGSAYIVTPVVALVRPDFVLRPNSHEVSEVFEVPLHFLMNPANHRHHQVLWQGVHRQWLSMPYQDGAQERFVWGATAGMLRNFYRFLIA